VDTGSANFAVAGSASAGAAPFFRAAASSTAGGSGAPVAVAYMLGAWAGKQIRDVVQIGGLPSVTVDFASIESAEDFFVPRGYPYQVA
jgi:hypothetical protein